MSEPVAPMPPRSLLRTLLIVVASVLVLLVLALEIGSRICDLVIASRKRDPVQAAEMVKRDHVAGFVEKMSYGYLEYGSILRADQLATARTEPHPYLGYVLSPNFTTPPGSELQARHNALGFRGKETTWEKPPGVYRIVTTGGSSVYGQSESSDAAVWSQRLEDYLNAGGGDRQFEVVNVGCPGWTSFEMLINLELRALDLQPDLVIVYEAINDMRAALYNKGGPVMRDNTHWRAVWPVDRPSKLDKLLGYSRTYLVFRRFATSYVEDRADLWYFAKRNFVADPKSDAFARKPPGSPIPEQGFVNYRRNLDNIVSLTHARGAKVLLVTQACPRWHIDAEISRQDQLDAYARIQNTQRDIANERGIPLFELAGIMEKAAEDELFAERARQQAANPGSTIEQAEGEARKIVGKQKRGGLFWSEVHPNDRGSDMIAKLVSDYLLASPLLAPK